MSLQISRTLFKVIILKNRHTTFPPLDACDWHFVTKAINITLDIILFLQCWIQNATQTEVTSACMKFSAL